MSSVPASNTALLLPGRSAASVRALRTIADEHHVMCSVTALQQHAIRQPSWTGVTSCSLACIALAATADPTTPG